MTFKKKIPLYVIFQAFFFQRKKCIHLYLYESKKKKHKCLVDTPKLMHSDLSFSLLSTTPTKGALFSVFLVSAIGIPSFQLLRAVLDSVPSLEPHMPCNNSRSYWLFRKMQNLSMCSHFHCSLTDSSHQDLLPHLLQ